jgi:selenide,water dikinase
MTPARPRLTSFSHGAGCACKLGPADLAEVLARLPPAVHQDLLVGPGTRDDAAVYRVGPDLAVILTADFITPIVDDPVAYGAIAVTNALSDVWAMGGEPLLGINLVGFPRGQLELDVLTEILSAGAAAAHTAGCVVAGGHTIDDPELKYGLAVVGRVHPDRVVTNSGGRAGDVVFLTKQLGLGIITTAAKRDRAADELLDRAVSVMRHPNRVAAAVMLEVGVDAATDVTGFGLLGHLGEMALGSGLAAEVDARAVPVLDGVRDLATAGVVPGGTTRNLAAVSDNTIFPDDMAEAERLVLADAQTSGGLLIAVAPGRADELERRLLAAGEGAARVARLVEGPAGGITVR